MNSKKEPVSFPCGESQLRGVLQHGKGDVGIIFCNAGARGRLGSSFQYPYYAHFFAEKGYSILRFDPRGIGDSDGEIEDTPMLDYYRSLQEGRYVDDTLAAIRFFRARVPVKKLLLLGICGGAITALQAAAKDDGVDELILFSLPVLYDAADKSEVDRLPSEHAREYLVAAYGKKLLSPKAWLRVFQGKSEFGTVWNYGRAALKDVWPKLKGKLPQSLMSFSKAEQASAMSHFESDNPYFNASFLDSLDTFLAKKGRVLFLLGEGDALRWDFEKEFYEPLWNSDPRLENQCVVARIPRCNHLFTLRAWQDNALEHIGAFL